MSRRVYLGDFVPALSKADLALALADALEALIPSKAGSKLDQASKGASLAPFLVVFLLPEPGPHLYTSPSRSTATPQRAEGRLVFQGGQDRRRRPSHARHLCVPFLLVASPLGPSLPSTRPSCTTSPSHLIHLDLTLHTHTDAKKSGVKESVFKALEPVSNAERARGGGGGGHRFLGLGGGRPEWFRTYKEFFMCVALPLPRSRSAAVGAAPARRASPMLRAGR